MDSETFRTWLAERGCRFDHLEHEKRGEGHAAVTVHREGRTALLPLLGSRKAIEPETVRAVCDALALDWLELPGSADRV